MKITVLAENSVCKTNPAQVNPENGLSLFIESGEKKILFDTGQSDLFLRNAEKLKIDISTVDYLFISHGHFDHGGGLLHFLKANKKARIFLHRNATNPFYAKIFGIIPYYVGLNQNCISQNKERIDFIDNDRYIDQNIILIQDFPEIFPQPAGNNSLYEKLKGRFIQDIFSHEMALLLIDKDEIVLFSGCSHSGIVNILEKVNQFTGNKPIKATFGGLHLYNPISRRNESPEYINNLTDALYETNTMFYTGHCTGEKILSAIQISLPGRIHPMNTGSMFEV